MSVMAERSVRVKEIVEQVRTQRSGMVQTEAQYKFLYDIIPHIVQAQSTVCLSVSLCVFVCLHFCLFVSLSVILSVSKCYWFNASFSTISFQTLYKLRAQYVCLSVISCAVGMNSV